MVYRGHNIRRNPNVLGIGMSTRRRSHHRRSSPVSGGTVVRLVPPEVRRSRIRGIGLLLVVGALTIVARLGWLQAYDRERWVALAERQRTSSLEIQGARGEIRDRAGRALATSVPTVAVGVHPHQVRDREQIIGALAMATGASPQ
ncbi:MAG: hypothetical protein KDD44_10850, partial [Bdellovibrionales bacterium]|nr:hypothetical protein [Bdellovibrionales bacterium]